MTVTITSETTLDEVTPKSMLAVNSSRTIRTIVVEVPGSSEPYISMGRTRLRSGTIELYFGNEEADAAGAEEIIAEGGPFTLVNTERPTLDMRFVPVGEIERSRQEAPNLWYLTFGFQEVAS